MTRQLNNESIPYSKKNKNHSERSDDFDRTLTILTRTASASIRDSHHYEHILSIPDTRVLDSTARQSRAENGPERQSSVPTPFKTICGLDRHKQFYPSIHPAIGDSNKWVIPKRTTLHTTNLNPIRISEELQSSSQLIEAFIQYAINAKLRRQIVTEPFTLCRPAFPKTNKRLSILPTRSIHKWTESQRNIHRRTTNTSPMFSAIQTSDEMHDSTYNFHNNLTP